MQLLRFFIVLVLVGVNSNLIEFLTDNGFSTSHILLHSASGSLLFIIPYLFITKQTVQFSYKQPLFYGKLLVNAIGIYLLFTSYKYLAASSVSVIQRIDIPIIIISSVLLGNKKSALQFWLSIWAIILFLFFVIDSPYIDEDTNGFYLAIAAAVCLSMGYLLIKKNTENNSIATVSIAYLISFFMGGLIPVTYGNSLYLPEWQGSITILALLQGVLQTILTILGVQLLKDFAAEKARLPFVIGAFSTLIIEMIIEKKWFSFNQIAISVIITGIIATICLNPTTPITHRK